MTELSTASLRHASRRFRGPTALVLSAALLSGLAACSADTEPAGPGDVLVDEAKSDKQRLPATAASDAVRELTGNNLAFAIDLLHAVAPEGNFFYSPHSISIALVMTYAGAAGDTKSEMKDTLHFAQSDADLHAAFNTLDQKLASRGQGAKGADGKEFRLRISNAAWAQRDYSFLSSYLDVLGQNYGAGVKLLDFAANSEGSRETINDWVSQQTEGKIPELLPAGSVNDLTRLVLTNTVYFNAAWKEPFKPEATKDGTFTRPDGSTVTAALMKGTVAERYGEGEGWQATRIDYDGSGVEFLAILPEAGSFAQFEQSLSAEKLEAIASATGGGYAVTVTMPRFEFRSKESLAAPLKAMGMPTAFSDQADFSAMNGSGGLQIQDVIHEGFVKVNEAGTEAAAATGVTVGVTSVPTPKELELNRAFLFVIRDLETGAALFIGRVVDPTAK
ncbi:MAG: serpin family protein [Polyangiaceae bacterium]|nr:serpin family protein [Polyangiaceae bacterium]